ncbi:MAG TPA: trypsin-like peptidase domain-containing protein [Gemmatimonadaceae bacterium]|nr:trypsin-like peptidase domain-containing protein [Gemmatimonadaceae bacterium]
MADILDGLARASAGAGFAELASSLAEVTVQIRMRGHDGGTGSGIVWRSDGTIVTNAHVARGERAAVELSDGRVFDARLERRDPRRDLALLRIDATGLRAARLGDSRRLRPGAVVVACGHPFGMSNVVTVGIVHRLIAHPRAAGHAWIGADITLAPGNSGGPLADADGAVVGVNAMIVGGLGVAIPAHAVERFLGVPARSAA